MQTRRLAVAIHAEERTGLGRRLWVAVAVTTLWRRRIGGALEGSPGPTPGRPRRLRLLRLSWLLWCLVCQITTGALPLPQRFVSEPWPAIPRGEVRSALHQKALRSGSCDAECPIVCLHRPQVTR